MKKGILTFLFLLAFVLGAVLYPSSADAKIPLTEAQKCKLAGNCEEV